MDDIDAAMLMNATARGVLKQAAPAPSALAPAPALDEVVLHGSDHSRATDMDTAYHVPTVQHVLLSHADKAEEALAGRPAAAAAYARALAETLPPALEAFCRACQLSKPKRE